jgi:5'-nucleotidase
MTDRTTRVLITNDDGIAAPGLRCLAQAARRFGLDVLVAAPQREASGMSAALSAVTEDGRLKLERTTLAGLSDVPAFSVAASPGYIAVLASLDAFGAAPDLVLSGINRGANAGRAILHSGTVGAALTAASHGMRAMAVSLDVLTAAAADSATAGATLATIDGVDDEARNWSTAGELVERLLPWLLDAPPGTVLNLNVPDRARTGLAGLRSATLAPFGQVQVAIAEVGEEFVRTTMEEPSQQHIPGTDIALLSEGYATITAIHPPGERSDTVLPAGFEGAAQP